MNYFDKNGKRVTHNVEKNGSNLDDDIADDQDQVDE